MKTGDEKQRERCENQGHDWENCMTAMLQVYQKCKWCGETRDVGRARLPGDQGQ